jgi:hypothetical protein
LGFSSTVATSLGLGTGISCGSMFCGVGAAGLLFSALLQNLHRNICKMPPFHYSLFHILGNT